MDVLRRNTDYALRAMANLADHYDGDAVSTKEIAQEENISYQLACKLMQKLHKAKLVKSTMGPKGGFKLNKDPAKIDLLKIIEAIQGPVALNRCLLNAKACKRRPHCQVSEKLSQLQKYINTFLTDITLAQLITKKGELKTRRKPK